MEDAMRTAQMGVLHMTRPEVIAWSGNRAIQILRHKVLLRKPIYHKAIIDPKNIA